MVKKIAVLLLIALTLGSCGSRKKIVYLQNISSVLPDEKTNFEPAIKPSDLLVITVFSPTPEAALRFNLSTTQTPQSPNIVTSGTSSQQEVFYTYLVDNFGNIEFPIIGSIKLGGLTKTEALAKLNSELAQYITKPISVIRIMNFKVTILGEVSRPGEVDVKNERITLPEALARAGDLTIYGKRDNVLIIREVDGKKTYNYVDITKADFMNSPYYYLTQNDLIVVEPNKTRIASSVIGPNASIIFTSVSLLITIITLISR